MPQNENARSTAPASARERLLARAAHWFTAAGVIPALLALDAVMRDDLRMGLVWLGVALVIDGLDGPLARKAEVARVTPRFDGAALDLVIDYLTYAVIPALMVARFALVPENWELPAAAFIMATSLYCFGNRDMKTRDNYFQGFPALWNVVVLYIYVLASPAWLNLAVIAGLGLLTFVPLKFVHPFRVEKLRGLTFAVTGLWAAGAVFLVWFGRAPGGVPEALESAVLWVWIALSLYFAGLSLWRSAQTEEQGT